MRIASDKGLRTTNSWGFVMMAVLIGLGISFALSGLVYLSYEDEIDEARELLDENDIDLDDFDLSDLVEDAAPEKTEVLADAFPEPEEDQEAIQTLASAQSPQAPLVFFAPEDEQIVVALDADVDVTAPAQNVFDPETDTTTLSFGDNAVLSLSGDQTDISVGFGTQADTEQGLSPFDIVLVQNRLELA